MINTGEGKVHGSVTRIDPKFCLLFRFQGGQFNPYHPYSFSACGMGGPGFYGPISAGSDEDLKGEETEVKNDGNEGEDKKENQDPTREEFMDPKFGGFYDDLAAGPPTDNLPSGERPHERGISCDIT